MPLAIGQEVRYAFTRRGKATEGVGKVVKVRNSGGFIYDMAKGESKGPAFEVQVKPNDGSKAIWLPGMADDANGTLAALAKQGAGR